MITCIIHYHPNEPQDIIEYVKKEGAFTKPNQNLPFDYLIIYKNIRIGVERKTSPDFVQSIEDGRLWEQLYSMSLLTPISFLVVIGNISMALIERKFPRSAYIGALISATIKTAPEGYMGHISIINLDTEYDFKEFMRLLCKKVCEEDFVRLPIKPVRKIDLKSLQIQTLATLPGVGEKYATKLLEKFGNIYRVVTASESELANVLGVARARKVFKYLRGMLDLEEP